MLLHVSIVYFVCNEVLYTVVGAVSFNLAEIKLFIVSCQSEKFMLVLSYLRLQTVFKKSVLCHLKWSHIGD